MLDILKSLRRSFLSLMYSPKSFEVIFLPPIFISSAAGVCVWREARMGFLESERDSAVVLRVFTTLPYST